jgi:isoamylase
VFRRRRFFQGRPVRGTELEDIAWLTPDGEPMTDETWTSGEARALTVFLNGAGIPEPDRRGRRVQDDSFLLMVNPASDARQFAVPGPAYGDTWTPCLDTAAAAGDPAAGGPGAGERVTVPAHSLRLYSRPSS